MRNNLNRLYTEISLKENHIVTIENFVEKYLPIRVMAQINETLSFIWKEDTKE